MAFPVHASVHAGDARPSGRAIESFDWRSQRLVRVIRRRDGSAAWSEIPVAGDLPRVAIPDSRLAEYALLRADSPPPETPADGSSVRLVDLFAGCGGLSLGLSEACRALGLRCDPRLAVDFDPAAAAVYADNFPGAPLVQGDVTEVFDGACGARRTRAEREIARNAGSVDILVGGPPCQGHSDLNNRTRRVDEKNQLYFTMVRAAEVLSPNHVVIENVPGALRDRTGVVQRAIHHLDALGYNVDCQVVDLGRLGVPQRRRRLVLVASRDRHFDIAAVVERHRVPQRTVQWAIDDLVDQVSSDTFNEPARSAPATRRRIAYLFDNDLYELPDSERPPCHAGGGHSYSSIYGRLSWDAPAQTITTGFYSMCMGRYVHPARRRTLTAHEAARLQFFPDYFRFDAARKRRDLQLLVGNAVPMKLSYVLGVELLR
jgi:DNA (cytosine-5)-methyltransferase 1